MTEIKYDESLDYKALNALSSMLNEDGELQLDADQEAVKRYMETEIKERTMRFETPLERIHWLLENNYYSKDTFGKYSDEFLAKIYNFADGLGHTFPSFMGAYKFYMSYALKTNDGKTYLETFSERAVAVALHLAGGDEEDALHWAEEIITGRYQPATPTFLNSGKVAAGGLVSCFPAGSFVTMSDGTSKPIEQVAIDDMVLTHTGEPKRVYDTLVNYANVKPMVKIKAAGVPAIHATEDHPILIWTEREGVKSCIKDKTLSENFYWVNASDVQENTDYLVTPKVGRENKGSHIDLTEIAERINSQRTSGYANFKVDEQSGRIIYLNSDKRGRASGVSNKIHPLPAVIPLNAEFGRFVGYYLAEGYVGSRKLSGFSEKRYSNISFTFGSKETMFIEDLLSITESLFGIKPNKIFNEKDHTCKITISSTVLAYAIHDNFGTGFDKKALSDLIISADDEFLYNLLIGAFRGDGCLAENKIILTLTNPNLVRQLREIAIRIGLSPQIREYVSVSGKEAANLSLSSIHPANEQFILDTAKNLQNYAEPLSFNKIYNMRRDGKYLSRVTSVTNSPDVDTVYNLEVEDNHTYLVSGVVVHNCFILHPSDNMESIARMVTDSLQLSKRGGGVGINLSNIREEGSPIKGVEGQSSGLVPVMKILDDSFRYANQLGARQGAGVAYIHACHPDVYRAMDTKRENADEATRIKILSLGLIIPDIVMELAKKNEKLYHFSVYDVEREYGCEYSDVDFTAEYYNMLNNPRIRKSQEKETFPARKLFATIAEIQFESGYPYILFIDHANRAHKATGRIKASNLCVTGETEILTGDGYRKVRDLYDSQEDFQVVVDERARLMDLSQSGTSLQESTKMFKTAENAQILKLETREGYSLRATPWHKMYVVREGELVKIPLSDVIPGDKVLVQGNKSNSFGETHMPDEAYICGVMASDGTFGSNRDKEKDVAKIDLWYDKSEFADRITRAIHNVLDGRLDLIHGHSGTLTPHFREAAGGKKVSLSSSALGRALKELGFTHKTKLQIPEFIKNSDKETQESYICGLFQLDGTITGSEKNGSISIEIGSVNKELLKDLQMLLLTHGVYTRIYLTKNAGMESLPDGRGGLKEYPTKNVYSLRTRDRLSRERLHDIVVWRKEREEYWKKRCESIKSDRYNSSHRYTATVQSITPDGCEDVYDVTVENGHSVIFNGIATGQCSEVLQASTPSVYNEDGSFAEVGRDISCNLGSFNVQKVMESPSFEESTRRAIRQLTAVSDLSSAQSSPTVVEGNAKSHAIGLGAMNLHGFFAKNHMMYADDDSVCFTDLFFRSMYYYAVKASCEIARERGVKFDGFSESKYVDGSAFDLYVENEPVVTDKVREVLSQYPGFVVPSVSDWVQLKEDVKKYGIYNAYLLAVAPTGSISYVTGSTSSIHPIVNAIETRKEGKTGTVYVPAPYLSEDTLPYYKTAYNMPMEEMLKIYEAATPHIDQGISTTLFIRDINANSRFMTKIYIDAWKKGLKTLYYLRVKNSATEGTENGLAGSANNFCESCSI